MSVRNVGSHAGGGASGAMATMMRTAEGAMTQARVQWEPQGGGYEVARHEKTETSCRGASR